MRIDGSNPIPQAGPEPVARDLKPVHVPQAAPAIQDHVETHQRPAVSPTNVLVEMQPGNIVVYKFIDEASGQLIQQIPSEQMLSLSSTHESPKESKNIS